MKRRLKSESESYDRSSNATDEDDDDLHTTGIRGYKVYIVYFVTILNGFVAISNLIVLVISYAKLGISKDGLTTLEFIDGGNLLKFLEDSDMGDNALIFSNKLLTRPNSSLLITGQNANEVNLSLIEDGISFSVGPFSTNIVADKLEIIDPDSGKIVFISDFDKLHFPDEIYSFYTEVAVSNDVLNTPDEDLNFRSKENISFFTYEDFESKSKFFSLSSSDDLSIETKNNLLINGKNGVFLDAVKYLPITEEKDGTVVAETGKLCVCKSSGLLFAVNNSESCENTGSVCSL